jgi:hypothetical protein
MVDLVWFPQRNYPTQAKNGLEWAPGIRRGTRHLFSDVWEKQILRCAQDFGRRLKRRLNASTSLRSG